MMRPSKIGQIAVVVEDIGRATTFYREVIGLDFLFAAPPAMAFFQCGEVRLMLSEPEGQGGESPSSLVYYQVEDPGSAHARLVDGGAEIIAEPHLVHRTEASELWIGFYGDREGNTFGTMAELVPSGGDA